LLPAVGCASSTLDTTHHEACALFAFSLPTYLRASLLTCPDYLRQDLPEAKVAPRGGGGGGPSGERPGSAGVRALIQMLEVDPDITTVALAGACNSMCFINDPALQMPKTHADML
jgi:hypothetical protein